MSQLVLILAVVGLVILAQLLLKVGMNRVGAIGAGRLRRPIGLVGEVVRTPAVVAGVVLYVLGAMGWIVVLSRVDLSFAYPFLGLSYVTVPILAVVLLGERFDRLQWLAALAVLVGVTLVAGSG